MAVNTALQGILDALGEPRLTLIEHSAAASALKTLKGDVVMN